MISQKLSGLSDNDFLSKCLLEELGGDCKYFVEVHDGTLTRVVLGFTDQPTEDEKLIIKHLRGDLRKVEDLK